MNPTHEIISDETFAKLQALERQRERDVTREQLVEALTKFANGASREEIAEFATDLSHEHRAFSPQPGNRTGRGFYLRLPRQ